MSEFQIAQSFSERADARLVRLNLSRSVPIDSLVVLFSELL